MSDSKKIKLGELKKATPAKIVQVGGDVSVGTELVQRLLEMGFLEGSTVEVLHEAPFGKDPVAIRVRGTLVALRRNEANAIEVVYE